VVIIDDVFLYKNLNLLNNYIINLVFNHFPFARIQGNVLFKLSIKSEMLLGPPEKTERISSDFASKKIRVKNELVLNYLMI
jgi:hypothetical protein